MKLCLSGKLIDEAEAHITPHDRGFLLGDGLFETMSVVSGQIIDLPAHLTRLRGGAKVLALSVPFDDQLMEEMATALIEQNQLQEGLAVLRLTISRGPSGRGLDIPEQKTPTWLLTAAPVSPPARTVTVFASTIRRNENSPLSRIKSLNYLENILARREAKQKGAAEALLYNSQGHLACASAANIWIVEGESLITPPLVDGVLNGIVRQRLFELYPSLNLKGLEQSITPERLKGADGIFLSNSLIGICEVSSLDGEVRADCRVISNLRGAYQQAIGSPSEF